MGEWTNLGIFIKHETIHLLQETSYDIYNNVNESQKHYVKEDRHKERHTM